MALGEGVSSTVDADSPLTTLRGRRGSVAAFVDAHTLWWELGVAVATTLYIGLSFIEDSVPLGPNLGTVTLLGLSTLFIAEFGVRFWDAPDRRRYFREHWIDLVSSVPFIGPLRAFRILRLLRFLRLERSIRRMILGGPMSNAWAIWPFLILFWLGSAYGLWVSEHPVNPAITGFHSALMYVVLTAATVGYGGFTPVTVDGKLICGAIVFVAIGLVGLMSARLTTLILDQKVDQMPHQVAAIERDVAEIKALLAATIAGPHSGSLPVAPRDTRLSTPESTAAE